MTNTLHPGVWVMILLPYTRNTHFGKSKHDRCIQHKFAKNTAVIRIMLCARHSAKSRTETFSKCSQPSYEVGPLVSPIAKQCFSTKGSLALQGTAAKVWGHF